jgi:hypothetical protein
VRMSTRQASSRASASGSNRAQIGTRGGRDQVMFVAAREPTRQHVFCCRSKQGCLCIRAEQLKRRRRIRSHSGQDRGFLPDHMLDHADRFDSEERCPESSAQASGDRPAENDPNTPVSGTVSVPRRGSVHDVCKAEAGRRA